jgi:hypothetical protein
MAYKKQVKKESIAATPPRLRWRRTFDQYRRVSYDYDGEVDFDKVIQYRMAFHEDWQRIHLAI